MCMHLETDTVRATHKHGDCNSNWLRIVSIATCATVCNDVGYPASYYVQYVIVRSVSNRPIELGVTQGHIA